MFIFYFCVLEVMQPKTAPSTAVFLDSTIIEPESRWKAQDVMPADPALFSVFSSAHRKDSSSW